MAIELKKLRREMTAVPPQSAQSSRSVYREERYHNKRGERERDVANFFGFFKQNFQVTRLMTNLS